MADASANNSGVFPQDIVEALCRTNLSAYESRMLWFVIKQTYGEGKEKSRITYRGLAKGTGLHGWHIFRTLRRLIKRCIITCSGTGYKLEYGLEKDCNKWLAWLPTEDADEPAQAELQPVEVSNPPELPPVQVSKLQPVEVSNPPAKKKSSTPPNPLVTTISLWLESKEVRGYPSPHYAREAKAIKWMLDHKYSEQQIHDTYYSLKKQKWFKDKDVFMWHVQDAIGFMKKGGKHGTTGGGLPQSVIDGWLKATGQYVGTPEGVDSKGEGKN